MTLPRDIYYFGCLVGMPPACPLLAQTPITCGWPECAPTCAHGYAHMDAALAIHNRKYDRVGKPHIKMGGPQ